MSYIGDEGRVVSSNYLFKMLQDLYTKIKGLLNNKADVDHTHDFTVTDVDTVDGYHADDFQKVMTALENNSNVLEYAENYPITQSNGTFFTYRVYNGYGEPYSESAVGSGDYYYYANKLDEKWITLIAVDVRSSNMFMKTRNDGTWGSWRNISNDGNADTLDGYHASNFAKLGYGDITDWDTLIEGGIYRMNDITSQNGYISGMNSWGQLLVIRGTGDTITQMYCNYGNNNIFSRSASGIGGDTINWTSWKKINDGGNADTLDGYHASNFLLTSGGTISGNLLATTSDTTERHFQVNNSLHNGHLCTSAAGNFGLYSNTHSKWLVRCDTSGNVVLNGNAVTSTTSSYSNNLNSTGFGNGVLTYCQTSDTFYDNTGWCHYIMASHGDGSTYYNYTIGLPFWDTPMYQRQTGNTSARSGWHKFYTTENITYGTSALTAGSSGLASGHIYLQYE